MKKKALCSALLLTGLLASGIVHAGKIKLLEVLTNPKRTVLLQEQLTRFQKENPTIEVELITIPWDSALEKALIMFKSGQIPDVVEMPDAWGALYVKGKQLEVLDPWIAKSKPLSTLSKYSREVGKMGTDKTYGVPYGYYMKALFYNKKMLAAAGVEPPKTQDDFVKAVEAVSTKLPGKYGYCLRGGRGGSVEWYIYGLTYNASNLANGFFDVDGKSNFATPAFQKGMQLIVDFYQKGYTPKESVSWGYNEIVTGFYSGTCAMLEQDSDALIGIAEKMDKNDFGVVPVPLAANGQGYPQTGYINWSITKASRNKDESWKLIEFLTAEKQNMEWVNLVGVLPVHEGAQTNPAFAGEHWDAWFKTVQNPEKYHPKLPPVYLPEWANLYDKVMVETGQEMLLGKRSVADVAQQWADAFTAAQKKFNAAR